MAGPSHQDPPTTEEMKRFLQTAEVVGKKRIGKGSTSPWRLTLDDGRLRHDAAFQSIDVLEESFRFDDGETELNFRDSYRYNIAAFELAELLDLEDMIPVTVKRRWNGEPGALSWWIDFELDERERAKRNLQPPNVRQWNEQMHRMRVFAHLIYDTDRNQENTLITASWKAIMIDFTRAFRRWKKLRKPDVLYRCDRALFANLRTLRDDELREKLEEHLTESELEALLVRRRLIVGHFEALIAERGEANVLY